MAEQLSLGWPFGALRHAFYRTIVADPPWRFHAYSAKGEKKNALAHYPCMHPDEIGALPVADLAHPEGCALTLWATAPLLPLAIQTAARWGFVFKSAGAWAKRSPTGAKWAFGTGYVYRSAAEFWVLATRGAASPQSRRITNLIVAPVRRHSEKPDEMRTRCEELWRAPRCELFARTRAPGWDSWGNGLPEEKA